MSDETQTARSCARVARVLLVASCALLACAGCQVARHSRDVQTTHAQSDIAVTAEQFRLRMRALVNPMCGQIEESADAIIAKYDDPKVQAAALDWKIQAVPAMREALFEPNPAMAAFDTLTLCVQMAEYFETGPGRAALGEASAEAASTCRRIEREFVQVVASGTKSGDVSAVANLARQWATAHPIQSSFSNRVTALSRVYERDAPPDSLTPGEALADANALMDDLNRRVEIYSDQLFRQARWEGERFRREMIEELKVDQLIPSIDRTAKSTEQIAAALNELGPELRRALTVAQGLPDDVAKERQRVLDGVHEELTRVLDSLGGERRAALEQFGKERALAVDSLREVLAQQRQQLARDADTIAASVTDQAAKRLATMLAIGMTVAIVVVVLLVALPRVIARRSVR